MLKRDHIIIKDRIWVPIHLVDRETVREKYTKVFFEERACQKCEYKPERSKDNPVCQTCEGLLSVIKLYGKLVRKGIEYIGVPIGDKKNFERKTGLLFEEVKIYDYRVNAPFDYPIKFIIDLYDYQEVTVTDFMKKKYGLLEAPPRTGKTAMALAIAIRLGQKTLMLANQHEFLTQFLDHIHGNKKEGIPKCTNLPELEKKYKKKLYGFVKDGEDFSDYQIMCCTYQQFLSDTKGAERLRNLFPQVGTVVVDEVHKSAAECFSRTVGKFPSRYRFGVSATIDRKDRKEVIVKHILGPVVARSARESLIPTVYVHETKFVPKSKYNSGPRAWVFAMQALAKDKHRNRMIMESVMRDLKAGHNIVIPVMFKAHVFELQRLINQEWESKICETFTGGGGKGNTDKRKDILARVKANKIRVIVGIRSMLQLGLNVPSWSCIYEVMPISNEPNLRQETSRVRTPVVGKQTPIVRLFIDENLGQSLGCGRNSIKHMRGFQYNFSTLASQKALVKHILGTGYKQRGDEGDDSGDYKATRIIKDVPASQLFKRL